MIKRILVVLAGTRYTPVAIRTAVDLAQRHGAELTGATAVEVDAAERLGGTRTGVFAEALTVQGIRRSVAEFEAACTARGVTHQVRWETGEDFGEILSLSRHHDLLVFGLRSVFEYEFGDRDPGVTLTRLLGGCCSPMVAVPGADRPVRRVLVAHNGSVGSALALQRFLQSGAWRSASLRIAVLGEAAGNDQEVLREAAAYCRAHGLAPDLQHLPGEHLHKLLPQAAQWGADLIVMDSGARLLLASQVLGVTTVHAVRHADQALFLA
ncbi:MAG: universal stress protein [Thermodesulfobacteriota bacterium]